MNGYKQILRILEAPSVYDILIAFISIISIIKP